MALPTAGAAIAGAIAAGRTASRRRLGHREGHGGRRTPSSGEVRPGPARRHDKPAPGKPRARPALAPRLQALRRRSTAGAALELNSSTPLVPTATFEDPTPSGLDGQWHDAATKLDLAKAYQEMGDVEGAREILQEVLHEGDDTQKSRSRCWPSRLTPLCG
jgi:FimV-like protein